MARRSRGSAGFVIPRRGIGSGSARTFGNWIAEKAYYRNGQFPNVSRTGNWADVAHYTQVVWRGTTHVGCAIYPTRNWDYLICRYSPPGNVGGRQAI